MGNVTVTQGAVFSTWLRGQMIQKKLSNRALGALTDPGNRERGRRRVLRHLSGKHFPSAASRAVYVEVFGLDADPFTDEDTEEDQALYRDLHREMKVLLAKLEKRVAA